MGTLLCVAAMACACGGKTQLEIDDPVLCVEVPEAAPPEPLLATFTAQIEEAEVMLLVDQTGSMDDEIRGIREGLLGHLLPAIRGRFVRARVGLAGFGDFPFYPSGELGDRPFVLYQALTDDAAAIRSAARQLMPDTFLGSDDPEAQVPALHHLVTNEGAPDHLPRTDCPPGAVGAACFTEGARIILLFTDAPFHNGPDGAWPYYGQAALAAPGYLATLEALHGAGARVIVLWSGDPADTDPALRIAADTGAIDEVGEPLVFPIGPDGTGLAGGVVDSIVTLVGGTPLEVDAHPVDVAGDAVDATSFITRTIAHQASPADGAAAVGERFERVAPGTRLTFSFELENHIVPAASEPQVFPLDIHYRDRGLSALGRERVLVVVPSLDGRGCESVRP